MQPPTFCVHAVVCAAPPVYGGLGVYCASHWVRRAAPRPDEASGFASHAIHLNFKKPFSLSCICNFMLFSCKDSEVDASILYRFRIFFPGGYTCHARLALRVTRRANPTSQDRRRGSMLSHSSAHFVDSVHAIKQARRASRRVSCLS